MSASMLTKREVDEQRTLAELGSLLLAVVGERETKSVQGSEEDKEAARRTTSRWYACRFHRTCRSSDRWWWTCRSRRVR